MTFLIRVFRPARFLLAGLALTLLPAIAAAQSYPALEPDRVIDDAGVLSDAQEDALARAIEKLQADTGVELAVMTVFSTADYGGFDSIESFVTGLFNEWGLGGEEEGNGILVFLARADREVRIELGEGFGTEYDDEAASIIDEVMVPAFQEDRYGDGVTEGTQAVIARVATPFASPAAAGGDGSTGEGGGNGGMILGGIGAAFLALIGFMVMRGRQARANRVCESCGAKGQVEITRRTVQEPTENSTGMGEKVTTCNACGHSTTERYEIAKKSPPASKDTTGGGASKGGGATGKW